MLDGESALSYARRVREDVGHARVASSANRTKSQSLRATSRLTRMSSRRLRTYDLFAEVVGTRKESPVQVLIRRDGTLVDDPGHAQDPLMATLTAARGCEHVSSVSFCRVGWRSGIPFVEATAHFDQLEEEPHLSIQFSMDDEEIGDARRIHLRGELDVASAPSAKARLEELVGCALEMDLSSLSFIDACGVAALVSAKSRFSKEGDYLRIVGAHGLVRRVLKIVDLESILDD